MRIALLMLAMLTALPAMASHVQYPNNPEHVALKPVLTGERYAMVRAASLGASVQVHFDLRSIHDDNTIVKASSPVAASVEWHKFVAKMEQRIDMTTAAHQHIDLSAGQFLVLCDLTQPLRAGTSFPVMLTFEHDMPATLVVQVIP